MDLTPRKGMVIASSLPLIALLLALTASAPAQPPAPPQDICVNQSPRNLKVELASTSPPAQGQDFNFVNNTSLVDAAPGNPDRVTFQARVLELCDRHYHVPVEDIQGCPNEKVDLRPDRSGPPPNRQWIEVHNVYAAVVNRTGECSTGHDHGLRCCVGPPFAVVGYSAQIDTNGDAPLPSINFAEWAGSATSENPNTGCNTTPATWHFGLGCEGRLTPASLDQTVGGKPHVDRDLQGPNRVSSDLTFVGPDSAYLDKVCRRVRTDPIRPDALAARVCPGVCKWPLNRFTGQWQNSPAGDYALCGCCPIDRPQ